jgi:hypothetical protein
LESYTQFVIHEVAKPLVLNEARSNHEARKREAALDKCERAMELERLAVNKAQEELHELQDTVTKNATETKMVLKSLREELLDDNAKMAAFRKDVPAEQDSGMQQEAAEFSQWDAKGAGSDLQGETRHVGRTRSFRDQESTGDQ